VAPVPPDESQQRRAGILRRCLEARSDCSEWEVEVDGVLARAVAFASLCGPLRPGDRVILNSTAVALALGTGGAHFVIARCDGDATGDPRAEAFPGREAGHILKLRYTPMQLRVQSVEEEGSPHREAVLAFRSLEGAPVVAAELHSQAAACVIAAAAAAPGLRIALVQTDSAALPLSFSRLVARLKADGLLAATVTVGQAFGGDYEAVGVYTGLIAARAAAGAELTVVTQGPGNVGTGTEYGFSGLALAEALHACDTLGGTAILAPRMSEADPRERHRGLSHHTRTILRCLRAPVAVPIPQGKGARELFHCPDGAARGNSLVEVDPTPFASALEAYRDALTTMGRSAGQDALFFVAAAAAGVYAAQVAQAQSNKESV
jgi:hypothetical protein